MSGEEPKYGYMCATDYNWEVGEALGGATVYASVEDLKRHRKCVEQCGIVKVEVKLVEIVDHGKDWSKDG